MRGHEAQSDAARCPEFKGTVADDVAQARVICEHQQPVQFWFKALVGRRRQPLAESDCWIPSCWIDDLGSLNGVAVIHVL